jgi:radical SAM protein with 4Fe4S-binding SPASM domain
MYAHSSAKEFSFISSRSEKITIALPNPHHILETILGSPHARRLLGYVTIVGEDGKCFFERLCENYDRPDLKGKGTWKWKLATKLIDLGLKKAGLDKELMKQKLFHHRPTVKALALTARSIARHGLSAPQRFSAPLFVVWNFTQACNLSCKHCYQNATHKPASNELTLEEKLRVVDQLADNFVPFLAIAGGEPLVSKDIWPVLEHANKRGIHLTIATNGTMLTPENVKRLKESGVKYIEVSVDSPDPEEHNKFRGVDGAWQRAIQGIQNSVAGGVRTGLATCVTQHTFDRVDDMVELAIRLGCQTFSYFNFIPVGRGQQIVDDDLTPGQREVLLAKLARHLQQGKINVISTAPQFGRACIVYGPQDGIFATGHAGGGQGKKTMVLARYIGGCGAGRCYCCIQPDGIVTPCVYIPSEKIGDLRRQSLAEIWDCELFEVLSNREQRSGHCRVCDYKRYCGGCRARALAYTGDITASDPGCAFNYPLWDEINNTAAPFLETTITWP